MQAQIVCDVAIAAPSRLPSRSRRRMGILILLALALAVLGIGISVAVRLHRSLYVHPEMPVVRELDVYPVFVDARLVEVDTTMNWLKVPMVVTREAVKSDHTLWLRMHVEDWDKLPNELMEIGLTNILTRYGGMIDDSSTWNQMGADAWDCVPQPARAMAFLNMIRSWTDHYQVGRAYGLDLRVMTDTIQAVAMAESWFEHRAVHVNRDGSQDIGLPGASAYARDAIRRLHAAGLVDFALTDDEYYDPFKATRMLTLWFQIMLDEAGGDVDLAIRAYNKGIGRAMRGDGDEYLDSVKRRRRRYIRNEGTSRAWLFLNEPRRAEELAIERKG